MQVEAPPEPVIARKADLEPADRRRHPRLKPDDVSWIREVRLQHGPRVDLLDLSPRGALLEANVQLKPGADHTIEIVSRTVEAVPLRVLRCQIAAIAERGALYRGACEFKRALDLDAVLRAGRLGPDAVLQRVSAAGPSGAAAAAGWQKIVVRYREGALLKGFTHDFHPSRTQFSLWPSVNAAPGERIHIPLSQLKAVFFVRDFDGNPGRADAPAFDRPLAGRRLEVTFVDDEVLLGTTLSYRPERIGFFVIPADRGANNLRVFVVASAIRHVRFP